MLDLYKKGQTIKEIANNYSFSVATISRQLKKILGEEKFLEIRKDKTKKSNIEKNESSKNEEYSNLSTNKDDNYAENIKNSLDIIVENPEQTFYEVIPLTDNVELNYQKDLSSISISEAKLPKTVYMIVDNQVELVPKLLNDFPEWSFLPDEDLNRKTIKIYFESKVARRECKKDQKVIKVPNTDVFKLVASKLISKGISRIVSDNQLIAL